MKKFSILSCGLLLTLVACGGTTTPSTPATPSETPTSETVSGGQTSDTKPQNDAYVPVEFDTTKDVTITFYHTMGQNLREVLDLYLEFFNEEYPNIKVEHTQVGGYDDVLDQVKTELSVGAGPDIAYCYADHVATYNKTRRVVKLDNLIADETYGLTAEQEADFIDGYYEEGRQFGDGYMYTLPFSKSTEVLYYNVEFFKEHNLKVPTTWDEMEEVCAEIKKIDPLSIPLGYDSESNLFITMCEQLNSPYTTAEGNDHFLFNNDTNKDFVKRLKTWFDKGYMTTQEIYGAYTSGLFVETGAGNQRSYMSIGSSAGATHQRPAKNAAGEYPFTVGITEIPSYSADNKKVISQGPSLCMFDQKDPQKVMASWLLMRYLTTNTEFQAEFSIASGYVPVVESVQSNEVYLKHIAKADGGDGIAALSTKVCLEQKDNYFTSDAFLGSSDARINVGALLQSILVYTGSDLDSYIDAAFENAVYQCNYSIGNV